MNISINMKLDIINVSSVSLFLISTIFSALFLRKIIQVESEKAIALAELGVNQKLYETTSKMKNDIECFKHDQSKIFSSLKIYIDEDRHQELKRFYYESLLPIQNNINQQKTATVEIENLYNIPLKSTICSSILKALELGIFVSIEIDEPIEIINMPIINLCRIIGIFIENAIEESYKVFNGKVLICFINEENGVLIVIKNTCENSQNITSTFQKGYTTKGKNHGYGLKIVKNLISENSNVFLNTFIKNDFFTQELFIENK
jgi:two-component system sensor histidine kinase AgrC